MKVDPTLSGPELIQAIVEFCIGIDCDCTKDEKCHGCIISALIGEVKRLKEGKFTEEEFQNLCHNFQPDDINRFKHGCIEYQKKLFGEIV